MNYLSAISAEKWELMVRKVEFNSIFEKYGHNSFRNALELGCGNGAHSFVLGKYCTHLTATELNKNRLVQSKYVGNITFLIVDAENLSRFKNCNFDLVFSSNLLEHLLNAKNCLQECKRVIKKKGVIIHTVPAVTWKLANILFYYLMILKMFIERFFTSKKAELNRCYKSNFKLPEEKRSIIKTLLPSVHGISSSNIEELLLFQERRWISLFEQEGLKVTEIIRLPFYIGYNNNFIPFIKLGNSLNLHSCTAFVLKKC